MADSQLMLELFFLHIRGGCSLTVLLYGLIQWDVCQKHRKTAADADDVKRALK